jgi:hypothetical protein
VLLPVSGMKDTANQRGLRSVNGNRTRSLERMRKQIGELVQPSQKAYAD